MSKLVWFEKMGVKTDGIPPFDRIKYILYSKLIAKQLINRDCSIHLAAAFIDRIWLYKNKVIVDTA